MMSSLSKPLPLNGGLADVFARFPAGSVVEDLPLVIDNGSFQCRAGFAVSGHASELTPERAASFRPLIHTRRGHKNAAVAGFPAASGNLISHLAAFLFIIIGILQEADLFLAE